MKYSVTMIALLLSACGNKSEFVKQDGATGSTKEMSIVGIMNPCGDNPALIDEVFLKLATGSVVASYSDSASGTNTRFVVIPAGSYTTSDGDNCSFTITSNGEIINESKQY